MKLVQIGTLIAAIGILACALLTIINTVVINDNLFVLYSVCTGTSGTDM
jgi:hypothetical protein